MGKGKGGGKKRKASKTETPDVVTCRTCKREFPGDASFCPHDGTTLGEARIDGFFKSMHQEGASDLHLTTGMMPLMRVHGDLIRTTADKFTHDDLQSLLYEILSKKQRDEFEETGDLDFAYEVEGVARYRANYFMQKYGIAAVFREIPAKILTVEELGLPPVCKNLAMLDKGLVLVTGPTGSGKSTSLAAIIDHANKNRKDHILTIEDPIEFVHESQGCVINHREVGIHTNEFATALRAALREDPDIILVGEMRDLETISLALEASATGHLVFGTLHTQSATKTVDRIINVFPTEQQAQIRTTLSEALKAVIAQTLFKRIDSPGRVAALEIMIGTSAVANLIREGKTFQLASAIQTGHHIGMMSMDDSIMKLLSKKIISAEEAYSKSFDKAKFLPFLKFRPMDSE